MHRFADFVTVLLCVTESFCSDVDECASGVSRCTQTCLNTIGSYTCSCTTGYRLDRDGYTCNGIDLTYLLLCPIIHVLNS